MQILEFIVSKTEEGCRADRFIAANLSKASRSEVEHLIDEGLADLNGKRLSRKSVKLKALDRVRVEWSEPAPRRLEGEKRDLKIIYEDEDLLVIDKPAGLVVHPAPGHWEGTLVHALVGSGKPLADAGGADRPGIVHRLDKDTSGLMMVAKQNEAHRSISRDLEAREVEKFYEAVVHGRVEFSEGRIELPIGRHPKLPLKRAVRQDGTGKEARTDYRVLERFRHATHLEVRIHTGRTHQIRVHLAALGYPVIGDVLYGRAPAKERGGPSGRLALHAVRLGFKHPRTGKRVHLTSKPPEDFLAMLQAAKTL